RDFPYEGQRVGGVATRSHNTAPAPKTSPRGTQSLPKGGMIGGGGKNCLYSLAGCEDLEDLEASSNVAI
ncbi:hypothetical protein HAX54_048340, partial [Datura stramonium]|nr:hypothetical protein [Datura stramonium]